ncbi:hypothetical protein PFISCL1PPCAC_3904, partial [Pristionchus fissidentatus]
GSIKMASPSVLSLCKKTSHSQATPIPGCDATRSLDAAATHAAPAAKKRKEESEAQVVIDLNDSDNEFAFLHSRNQEDLTIRNEKNRNENHLHKMISDEEEGPKEKKKKKQCVQRNNLICPICSIPSMSVRGLTRHLEITHNSNPKKENILFKCSYGHETQSRYHEDFSKCDVRSRFFVIIKMEEAKARNKCTLCNVRPGSVMGFCAHLQRSHKSTLVKESLYLVTECGEIVRTGKEHSKGGHNQRCECRSFTVNVN